ncbi:hypothetical protein BCR44DRAFT_119895 [Catenaria anguillulae PL171]|uniref:CBS domain-containing protein n=1 Tax=Catenaria anguillulae PL171 TaxID=765915 RepID=A0A1Y2HJV9_9FUNG|nr:hypothetical protein BCR44DRAFT_119895 [Catenaria anguillulae PL171]
MSPIFNEEQHAQLRAAWARTHVDDLLKAHWKSTSTAVVTVDSTMSCEEAFDRLVQHNINAAPVWDAETKAYVGMVSMLDVVEFVLMLVKANKAVWQEMDAELATRPATSSGTHAGAAHARSAPGQEQQRAASAKETDARGLAIAEIASRIRQVKPIPVSYISDLAKRDPFMCLPRTATLDKAMDIFAKGIHRIVITESEAEPANLVGILTQSDMTHWLSENGTQSPFDQVLKMKLSELRLSQPKDIIYVKSFQPVLEALQSMQANRVSSVAVVDASDRLLGNISATDVKHIMRHLRYGVLFESCAQFIGGVKTRQMLENAGKDTVPVIQVSPNASLSQVLRLLVVTRVHRVWCTQQDSHASNFQSPVAVVSLTDILRVLL